MPYSPAYMQQSIMENQETTQLYNSAMQGLSSYATNIMGHTMNQYAAQSSLLSTQVVFQLFYKSITQKCHFSTILIVLAFFFKFQCYFY